MLNREDEIDDLKRSNQETKSDVDKRDKLLEDFKTQIFNLNETINELENEKLVNSKEAIALSKATVAAAVAQEQEKFVDPVVVVETKEVMIIDESLVELNAQLNQEMKQLQVRNKYLFLIKILCKFKVFLRISLWEFLREIRKILNKFF